MAFKRRGYGCNPFLANAMWFGLWVIARLLDTNRQSGARTGKERDLRLSSRFTVWSGKVCVSRHRQMTDSRARLGEVGLKATELKQDRRRPFRQRPRISDLIDSSTYFHVPRLSIAVQATPCCCRDCRAARHSADGVRIRAAFAR